MYSIKEVFYTLQGEGFHTGRPAVFCRFSGCNLWSGLEKHRPAAVCRFCDTDFRGTDGPGGGKFRTAEALVAHVASFWPEGAALSVRPFVVCTGGEPLLQLDNVLLKALQAGGFEVAVETNGTLPLPGQPDWVTLSPKGRARVVLEQCDELKLVYPQPDALPEQFGHIRAKYYFLTPMAGPAETDPATLYRNKVTRQTIEYCLKHPQWRLNLQSHKVVNIP